MTAIRNSILLLSVAAMGLSACNRQDTSKVEVGNQSVTVPTPAKTDPDASSSSVLAAAEPFETLTEQAATAKPDQLKSMIADIHNAADDISPALSASSRMALGAQLADVEKAAKAGLRTDVALSAVEGYRTLVESASDTGKVPRSVSLLDYAGFRYQANLAANPINWKDIDASVDFAKAKWSALAPNIKDLVLSKQFAASVDAMSTASKARDEIAAKKAVSSELDLVDKLESYFAKNG